jgi:hypothetical protein
MTIGRNKYLPNMYTCTWGSSQSDIREETIIEVLATIRRSSPPVWMVVQYFSDFVSSNNFTPYAIISIIRDT